MPTYDDLRFYFEERRDLREIAGGASKNPIVTGITLDVDPVWALIHDQSTGLIDRAMLGDPGYLEYLDRSLYGGPGYLAASRWGPWNPLHAQYQGYRRRDLYHNGPLWKEIAAHWKERFGRERLPLVMSVIHRPAKTPTAEGEESNERNNLRNLIETISKAPVFVRIEERPQAWFSFAAGGEITTSRGKSGTLGGVLVDSIGGKSYGVTCAHVASKGDGVKDGSGTQLGACIADTARVPLARGTVCDPIVHALPNPYPGNGPSVNMLDCALVDLASSVSTPQLAGIARALTSGQDVVMRGAQSKIRCKLGSLAISYGFLESGQGYCFRDTVEVLPQPWGPFGGPLGTLTTVMPTQGDSGSWLLTDDAEPVWAGMLFGEDGRRGFAIRASWVQDWAQSVIGSKLQV